MTGRGRRGIVLYIVLSVSRIWDSQRQKLDVYHRIAGQHGPCACRIVTADRSRNLRRYCTDHGLEILNKPIDRAQLLDFLNEVSAAKRLMEAG